MGRIFCVGRESGGGVRGRARARACASPLLQLPSNVEVGDASKDQHAAGECQQQDGVPL